jgi:SAM-dependent methyltransferase
MRLYSPALPAKSNKEESSMDECLLHMAKMVLSSCNSCTSLTATEYGLPIDDQELDRLDMAHAKYHLMSGGHYLAPIALINPKRILDIGTGTGIWAIDVADQFPEAEVIGTDLAPCQPQWVPTNCSFQIDDAEQDWTFPKSSFDFIHQRDSLQGIRNWPKFGKQCFEHLKPGGYVEWSSVHVHAQSDDGTLPKDAAIVELVDTFNGLTIKMGADPHYPTKLKSFLEGAGFENVVERVYKVPSSPWAKDPTMKSIGAFEYLNIVEGAEGFLIHGYNEWMGRSLDDLRDLVARLKRELGRNKQHCYVQL